MKLFQLPRWTSLTAILLISVLVPQLGACGGEDISSTPTPVEEQSFRMNPIERAEQATVRIVVERMYIYPGGKQRSESVGSGFIIDDQGTIVTNNHVVTGARIILVHIPGEDTPRSAQILGVSECSDLAVIQISEGDVSDLVSLDWYEGEIKKTLRVHSIGYIRDEDTPAVESGAISQIEFDVHTDWASVDEVLRHSARLEAGSSGGPLVTENGEVVAVNYARDNSDQYFAIPRNRVLPLIEQLRSGEDDTSIGISGQAFRVDDEQERYFSGIWVSAVDSGSLADRAQIKAGDLIIEIKGGGIAEDSTMSTYCDILRSHNLERDSLELTVLREYDNGEREFIECTLNASIVHFPPTPADTPHVAEEQPTTERLDAEPSDLTAVARRSTATPSTLSLFQAIHLDSAQIQQARDQYAVHKASLRQVLHDTFDNEDTKRRWRFERLRHSTYRFNAPPSLFTDPWDQQRLGNEYIVQLDVVPQTPGSMVGILYNWQDDKNWSAFMITGEGTWYAVTKQNDTIIDQKQFEAQDYIIGGGNVNQIRVEHTTDRVQFWINDTPVGRAESRPFSSGYVGIAGKNGTIIADNLLVLTR